MMILSVHLPDGGYDEDHYIIELEVVRISMQEGKAMGTKDFFIGGDANIELKLEGGSKDFEVLNSIDRCCLCGPECRGGGEDMATYGKVTLAAITESL